MLWQPFEVLIICGAAIGGFFIANPKTVILGAAKQMTHLLKGTPYKRDHFLELLVMLYAVFKLANSKGALALEPHIENPEASDLFAQYPKFAGNHHAVEFLCDALRLITMGSDNPHVLEAMLDEDIEILTEAEIKYFHCLKAGILAHVQGHAPAVSVEYARKCLFAHDRPSFADIEEAVASVQAA